VKISIPKDQLKELLEETQPSNTKTIDVFVRTNDREDLDFDELILHVEISPPII